MRENPGEERVRGHGLRLGLSSTRSTSAVPPRRAGRPVLVEVRRRQQGPDLRQVRAPIAEAEVEGARAEEAAEDGVVGDGAREVAVTPAAAAAGAGSRDAFEQRRRQRHQGRVPGQQHLREVRQAPRGGERPQHFRSGEDRPCPERARGGARVRAQRRRREAEQAPQRDLGVCATAPQRGARRVPGPPELPDGVHGQRAAHARSPKQKRRRRRTGGGGRGGGGKQRRCFQGASAWQRPEERRPVWRDASGGRGRIIRFIVSWLRRSRCCQGIGAVPLPLGGLVRRRGQEQRGALLVVRIAAAAAAAVFTLIRCRRLGLCRRDGPGACRGRRALQARGETVGVRLRGNIHKKLHAPRSQEVGPGLRSRRQRRRRCRRGRGAQERREQPQRRRAEPGVRGAVGQGGDVGRPRERAHDGGVRVVDGRGGAGEEDSVGERGGEVVVAAKVVTAKVVVGPDSAVAAVAVVCGVAPPLPPPPAAPLPSRGQHHPFVPGGQQRRPQRVEELPRARDARQRCLIRAVEQEADVDPAGAGLGREGRVGDRELPVVPEQAPSSCSSRGGSGSSSSPSSSSGRGGFPAPERRGLGREGVPQLRPRPLVPDEAGVGVVPCEVAPQGAPVR